MPVHQDFAYRAAQLLFQGTAMPYASWRIAPLKVSASAIRPDSDYDASLNAFPPNSIGNWGVSVYVPEEDPPPPYEILPYAYLLSAPSAWTNSTGADVIVAAVAVLALDTTIPGFAYLFWQGIDPHVTVADGETFEVTDLRFEIAELGDP